MEETNEKLEKIDVIRERTGVGYKVAKEALIKANGDVVEAIVKIEEDKVERKKEFHVAGNNLIEKIKELIKRGNITKIKVKKGKEIIFSIPVTVGVLGTMIYPPLAVLGMLITVAGKYTLEVEYGKA
ncbi:MULTISPECIES: DUF4342 domain-containing protein [unclassified Candidatus Frackibacter]|uniref:DUF4342 domain-containing protein n=1 Tax=unclassified Candidatus Frackibacter TaxID=2648818 RepID=UPI0007981905|nr:MULTISPECIES: DUF4342 domain-containing protein [unclassified Candidatus Frackibacter]KXS42265.1 MAG: ubiquitin-associated-domain-containing protein [Candidatus Frackibacter sp. T328-2]SDC74526.1 protein of unknown function [Candidatus Frackibacter sp. WG11]SEM88441.1 protein of unknown function [Candidatus Frackibacter sp. WG12]SFL97862.1 protein of unknown function [Candidatus Frackibacter sp. WG13]